MRRSGSIALLLALLLASGCAYYNTYYHARKYYEDAERQRAGLPLDRRSSIGLDLYEKAMKKCAKVIVLYPGSKWVDDAILLMGKCMYAKGDYLAALGKFDEVARYYGESDIVEEAEFYRAKALIKLGRRDEAVDILNRFLEGGEKKRRAEAVYLYGTVAYEEKRYDEAAKALEQYLDLGGDVERKRNALYLLGDSYRESGDYAKAYTAYERRLDDVLLPREERLQTSLDLTEVLIEEERFDDAYRELEDIRRDVVAREDSLKIDYRIGKGYLAEGRIDEAAELFRTSLKDAPKSEVTADMAYTLGGIYLDQYGQRDSAAAAFRIVTTLPAREEIREDAARTSKALNDYIRLREEYVADGADTARIQFLLAENEFFRFGEVDSAWRRYDLVANRFTESEYAPRALAAKAYIMELRGETGAARDSVLETIVRRYPRSDQAAEFLDRGEISVPDDSLAAWIAEYDEIYGAPAQADKPAVVQVIGRVRVFPGEGEVTVPGKPPVLFGPPGPLRLLEQAVPDRPLVGAADMKKEVVVDVEVEVDGLGRVREAWIVESDSPEYEGPALAAAYLSRYKEDGAEENRRATLRFRFRP